MVHTKPRLPKGGAVSRVGTVGLRGRDLWAWLRAGRIGLLVEMRGGELP